MSDLPERIAVKKLSGMLTLDSVDEPIWPDAPTTIYLRADLAPAVGYSREQSRTDFEKHWGLPSLERDDEDPEAYSDFNTELSWLAWKAGISKCIENSRNYVHTDEVHRPLTPAAKGRGGA